MTSFAGAPDHPTAILVCGLGLDDRAWALLRDRLAEPARVITLPSLGRRAGRRADLRTETLAQHLLDQPDVISGPVVLVGWSASCAVVVEAALRSRAVVGLVLIGPVTDPRTRTWPRMLSQWFRTATHEQLKEIAILAPQYRRTTVTSMVRGIDAMRWYRTDLALSGVRVPVVVVRGERDRIAAGDWSARLVELAQGRLVTVRGGAHMVPLTHPDAVAAAVNEVVDDATESN